MKWSFTKMQGTGNDFVVLDGLSSVIDMTPLRAQAIANRHFGVGCDQILLVDSPTDPNADFRYRIFNADGSEVEHCGNGARCFVRFVHARKLSARNPIRAEIATGMITLMERSDGQVRVEMGQTRFGPLSVAFDADSLPMRASGQDTLYGLTLDQTNDPTWISLIAISNPHAVQVVQDLDNTDVAGIGAAIESHPRFANRVNAGFMQIIDQHTIALRVYERGVGETLACGTGACAAATSGIRQGLVHSPVTVKTRGGDLTIELDADVLHLTGAADFVFDGELEIDRLVQSLPKY
jgi:diaminopimelate epimerase